MKRYAAHYIILSPDEIYKQHYIELNHDRVIVEVAPLTEEISDTAFYNGILLPVFSDSVFSREFPGIMSDYFLTYPQKNIIDLLKSLSIKVSVGEASVILFQLDCIQLLPSEFGTNNSGSHCHVQRL